MARRRPDVPESFEVLVCQVCMEDMVNREPRTLSCNHTFCTKCLSRIIIGGAIECPTCRRICIPERGNIATLPINFTLTKVQERELELVLNQQYLCQACMLLNKKARATVKCLECFRLLCGLCLQRHDMRAACRNHTIKQLVTMATEGKKERCREHRQDMSYYCNQCCKELCVDCLLTQEHDKHSEKLKPIDVIISNEQETKESSDDGGTARTPEQALQQAKKYLYDCLDELQKKQRQIQFNIDQAADIMKMFDDNAEELIKRIHHEKDLLKHQVEVDFVKQERSTENNLTSVKKEIQLVLDFIEQVLVSNNQEAMAKFAEKQNSFVFLKQGIHKSRHGAPFYLPPTHTASSNLIGAIKACRFGSCFQPKLMLAKSTVDELVLSGPVQLCPLAGDSVLLVDGEYSSVVQLNTAGEVTAAYHTPGADVVTCAATLGGHVVLGTAERVFMSVNYFAPAEKRTEFKPKVDHYISKIAPLDSKNIILSDRQSAIFTFNMESKQTKCVIDDLDKPSFLSVCRGKSGMRYLVTERNKHRICVYNEEWKLENCIGGPVASCMEDMFDFPCATVVLESSARVLVADRNNHRVSMFTLDGKFIRHVLNEANGVHYPVGLAYMPPYLWVTGFKEKNVEAYVKCFAFE